MKNQPKYCKTSTPCKDFFIVLWFSPQKPNSFYLFSNHNLALNQRITSNKTSLRKMWFIEVLMYILCTWGEYKAKVCTNWLENSDLEFHKLNRFDHRRSSLKWNMTQICAHLSSFHGSFWQNSWKDRGGEMNRNHDAKLSKRFYFNISFCILGTCNPCIGKWRMCNRCSNHIDRNYLKWMSFMYRFSLEFTL